MAAATASAAVCAIVLSGFVQLKAAAAGLFLVIPFAALGALIYAGLRKGGPVRLRTTLATGFALAAGPSALVSLNTIADEASIGDVATIVHGHLTAAGWVQGLLFSGGIGMAGMGAAALFFALVRKDARGKNVIGWRDTRPALAIAALALAFIAVSFYSARDRSCHNHLRNRGSSVAPVAEIKVQIEPEDWRALGDELMAFGESRGWSVQSDREWQAHDQRVYVDLCKEPGTSIALNVMQFPTGAPTPFDHEVNVDIYQPQGGASWQEPFAALTARLAHRWPGRVEGKPTGQDPRPQ